MHYNFPYDQSDETRGRIIMLHRAVAMINVRIVSHHISVYPDCIRGC